VNQGRELVPPIPDRLDERAPSRCRNGADDVAIADSEGDFVNPEYGQAFEPRTGNRRFQAVDEAERFKPAGSFRYIKCFDGKRSIAEQQKGSGFHQRTNNSNDCIPGGMNAARQLDNYSRFQI
jgi:hypothetical protein